MFSSGATFGLAGGRLLAVTVRVVGVMLLPLLASLAHAQPELPDAGQVDQRAYEAMLKQERALEATDPEAALALMEKFGQNHRALDAGVRVTLLGDAANLAFDKLHDKERALKIATQSQEEAKLAVENGASDFLLARAVLFKGRILMSAGQTEDAQALIGGPENWKRYALLLSDSNPWQRSYGEAAFGLLLSDLETSKRPALAVTKIEELLRFNPAAAATNSAGVADRMAENLLNDDKPKAALSWGKLSFMLADFDNDAIARSTKLLARAWASSGDLAALRDFTKAQNGDTSVKNPLEAVTLPDVVSDPASIAALSQLAGEWEKSERVHDAISAYLLMGQWLPAMQRAQEVWLKDPQSAAGVQEVGRVFKAADFAPTRGNAFVAYVNGTGQGNPLQEFLQQRAADKATDKAAG